MQLFLELIQTAIGFNTTLSTIPSEEKWQEAFLLAEKHALVGLLFSAIEKLNNMKIIMQDAWNNYISA